VVLQEEHSKWTMDLQVPTVVEKSQMFHHQQFCDALGADDSIDNFLSYSFTEVESFVLLFLSVPSRIAFKNINNAQTSFLLL
jgi:hypothetical protein